MMRPPCKLVNRSISIRSTRYGNVCKCRRVLAVVAAILPMSLLATPAGAQIEISIEHPIVGQEVTLTLSKPADQVTVTYRPNSAVKEEVTIKPKTAGPAGTFTWTPDRAGIASLKAGSATKNLSVRFHSFPWAGLLIMLFAGAVLFGGAGFALRSLFQGASGIPADYDSSPMHHPDT
ncbi:MAG: hypothetical protein MJE77_05450 [Proteobacteria bacterium]|nr:hypothetical protein [Pseudomonadota bacterium]